MWNKYFGLDHDPLLVWNECLKGKCLEVFQLLPGINILINLVFYNLPARDFVSYNYLIPV